MKKITFTLILAFAALSARSQQISTFENIAVPTDSTLDGSQGDTVFTSGSAAFPVEWDTDFMYWSAGWAISNRNDSTKTGFDGLYYNVAGKGQDGSANFAIGNNWSIVRLDPANATTDWLSGLYITNSSYAYSSMKEGDAFAKKFGGVSGNDTDYFLLTIKGYKNGQLLPESVKFYLADFRFADNSKDYIVKDWTWVDLDVLNTATGMADSLLFELTSTDNSGMFMNTPGFFCIDNLTIDLNNSVKTAESTPFVIYPNPSKKDFYIKGISSIDSWKVFDLNGREVLQAGSDKNTVSLEGLYNGVYVLQVQSEGHVSHYRIIKN